MDNCHKRCENQAKCIYSYTSTSPSTLAQRAYEEAVALRQQLATFTSIQGVTNCGMKFLLARETLKGREIVEVTDYCRNKHVCPVCMRYAYSQLNRKLAVTLKKWHSDGKTVYTQTLTLPNRNKPLIYKHDDLAKTWQKLGKSKRFGKIKRTYGLSQSLRVLEDVLSVNKPFPHYHLTWFFDSNLSEQLAQEFCQEIAKLWVDSALHVGVRGAQAVQQWSGPIGNSMETYSRYLSKHGYFDLVHQIQLKDSNQQSMKPLDFLRLLVQEGDYDMLKLWTEYEQATFGRRRLQTSRDFHWAA